MSEILIKNAKIIDSLREDAYRGDIYVEEGYVSEIASSINKDADLIIDATGMFAAPGLIDMHVHTRDPGLTHKADIFSVGEAAAAGGVTSIVAMPNTKPPVDNIETVEYISNKAANSKVRVYPVGAITKDMKGRELTDFDELKKAGVIAFSDDGEPVADSDIMAEALQNTKRIGALILSHCEDKILAGGGLINEGKVSEKLGVKGISSVSESTAIARDIEIAKKNDSRLHICHVSTAESVDIIRHAKSLGKKITAETCPHYFALTDEMLETKDADYRMNPPLRTEDDRIAVIKGLLDGTIDTIATDHAPHTPEEKADFYSAPNGVVGLQTLLAAGITFLVKPGHLTLTELIKLMTSAPASILGLNTGILRPGIPADIVLFDADKKWAVNPDTLIGNSKNSAFKGLNLTGKVEYTICNGKITYKNMK